MIDKATGIGFTAIDYPFPQRPVPVEIEWIQFGKAGAVSIYYSEAGFTISSNVIYADIHRMRNPVLAPTVKVENCDSVDRCMQMVDATGKVKTEIVRAGESYDFNPNFTNPEWLVFIPSVTGFVPLSIVRNAKLMSVPPSNCNHQWVDTGFRKSWCKHCNVDRT